MELKWVSFQRGRIRGCSPFAARHTGYAEVERLEDRTLLAITVAAVSASAGLPFTGLVATLDQNDVAGTLADIHATIAWGDGQSSTGSVSLVGTNLEVQGSHTYAVMGNYPLLVTVTGTPPTQISGQGTATVAETRIVLTGSTVATTLGQPFDGTVASFNDSYTGQTASSYTAVITWGDGMFSQGQIQSNGTGGYDVLGSHTYASIPAAGAATVQVVRLIDGEKASANMTVLANPLTVAFSGMLEPSSDTGVSNTDGITSINQPTFRGTASPYSVVQLLARPQGQSNLVPLGQTVANASGNWTLTAAPMRDGIYGIFANVTPPNGFPMQAVPLSVNNQLVIDTAGPRVVSVVAGQKNHQILVSFQDQLSGLDLSTLTNPANYTLIGPHPRRMAPSSVSLVNSATVLSSDPQMVLINATAPFPITGLRIIPGGIRDVAGNPLNGLYSGRFPSGGYPQGSSFVYRFPRAIHQTSPARGMVGLSAHRGRPGSRRFGHLNQP